MGVRLHLARELHDEVAQPLIDVLLQVRELRTVPLRADDLTSLEESLRRILRQVREMMLDFRERGDLRLSFVENLKAEIPVPKGRELKVSVSTRWPAEINGWAAFNLLRIVQQAVANAWRHGRAHTVKVVLDLGLADDAIVVVVDDGVGIDGVASYGFGITGMEERATILGGTFSARPANAGGTRVEVRVPVTRLK
jgi:signal transduction histidine kinase